MKQGGLQATVFIEPKVLPSVCDKECSGLPSLCFYRPFRNVATRLHRLKFRVGGRVSLLFTSRGLAEIEFRHEDKMESSNEGVYDRPGREDL